VRIFENKKVLKVKKQNKKQLTHPSLLLTIPLYNDEFSDMNLLHGHSWHFHFQIC